MKTELRTSIYRVANAALGIAVVYNLLDGNESAAWLLLVNAVLGLADYYVPRNGPGSGPGSGPNTRDITPKMTAESPPPGLPPADLRRNPPDFGNVS